jgi:hypothetical protein
MTHHLEKYHMLYQSQAGIGWDQLYYGWFSYLWKDAYESSQLNTSTAMLAMGGTQWISEVTMLIWQLVLQWWQACNGDRHGCTMEECNTSKNDLRLKSMASTLFDQSSQ